MEGSRCVGDTKCTLTDWSYCLWYGRYPFIPNIKDVTWQRRGQHRPQNMCGRPPTQTQSMRWHLSLVSLLESLPPFLEWAQLGGERVEPRLYCLVWSVPRRPFTKETLLDVWEVSGPSSGLSAWPLAWTLATTLTAIGIQWRVAEMNQEEIKGLVHHSVQRFWGRGRWTGIE